MFLDTVLAYAHHLAVFTLVSVLFAEWVGLRAGVSPAALLRIAKLDALYGASAGLALAFGFLRVFHGAKGAAFYLGNPVFWTKIALFAVVGLLSIVPTLRLMRWRKALRSHAGGMPDTAAIDATRRWISVQLLLVTGIPLAAAAMARGVGY